MSQNEFPNSEIEIMKKFDNKYLVKFFDSFSMEIPFFATIHGIVMDFYEV